MTFEHFEAELDPGHFGIRVVDARWRTFAHFRARWRTLAHFAHIGTFGWLAGWLAGLAGWLGWLDGGTLPGNFAREVCQGELAGSAQSARERPMRAREHPGVPGSALDK